MRVKVLGCSGGIGGILRTTGFLIDEDILLDAGTGVGDLSFEQLCNIGHVFLTHSHLDHIASLPLLLDTVFGMRQKPVIVYATRETWDILKTHVFNWKVWPDFSVIPDEANALLRYQEIRIGETISLGSRRFTALPANHVVPAVGYHLEGKVASMVFTGDTTTCDALWKAVNRIDNLKYLIIETAFSNGELEIAKVSRHLCPSLLIEELSKLKKQDVRIYITHLKPGEGEIIMHEIERDAYAFNARPLYHGHIFEI